MFVEMRTDAVGFDQRLMLIRGHAVINVCPAVFERDMKLRGFRIVTDGGDI